jgi:hypothetical protein
MRLLIVPRNLDRLAAVQLDFSGGKRRSYALLYRPATRTRPAEWWARSLADVTQLGDLDLRNPEHAARLEVALLAVEVELQ